MTKRKIARSAGSILLSLALVISGFGPGTSSVMNAYAAGTTKTIEPSSGSGEDKQGTGTMDIVLNITKEIQDSWITLSATEFTYNGSTQKPTVTVKYTAGTEQTLTEDTDYTVTIKDSKGNDVTEPKNADTYTITVTAKDGSCFTGSGSKTYTIKKSTPSAPAAPTVESQTKTSVTLVAVGGYEYSMDGTNWQESTEFTGLLSGTEYSFYQRVKATNNTNASNASEALKVNTEEDTYSMTISLVITEEDVVTNKINNLPDADKITVDDNDSIVAAREAYDALTDEQKAKVSADTLKKLTDDESALAVAKVNKAISDLKDADKVTKADKDAIEAAREAYDALTDEQKAKISADTLKKMTDAEDVLTAIGVSDTINSLPASDEVALTDKEAIEAAREAYDALSENQKNYVSEDTLKKLTDSEAALKEVTDTAAAEAVTDTINKLPASDKVATKDKEAIEAARAAYDALTEDQKAKVSADTLKKLTDAETALATVEAAEKAGAEKKAADEAAAKAVTDKINALPSSDKVATTDKEAIEAARKAYDALTADQKKLVDTTTLKKLTDAEAALTAAEESEKAASEKKATDEAAAKAVTDKINALPSSDKVATTDKEAIEAARKAYNALTADQKKLVDAATLKKLTDAETALTAAENKKDEAPGNNYSSEWVDGLWYNADGTQTYGYKGSWKTNGFGWWYEAESGWYPVATWQKIDGKWYYFDAEGYMASNEWIGGYWLSGNGAWEYEYIGSWKTNGTNWWYEDTSGWYPVSQWQKIDGKWYYFGSDGIMATDQYIGEYWVGSDGSWQ